MRPADSDQCFDLQRAEFPTRSVPIGCVIDLLQVPHEKGKRLIEEYRSAMLRGARFPPIAVIRWRNSFLIADGHKRFSAFRSLERRHIVVEVWPIRRWLRDQGEQLARKTRQQVSLLRGSFTNADARRQTLQLFWDTVAHWQRIARSLASRIGSD